MKRQAVETEGITRFRTGRKSRPLLRIEKAAAIAENFSRSIVLMRTLELRLDECSSYTERNFAESGFLPIRRATFDLLQEASDDAFALDVKAVDMADRLSYDLDELNASDVTASSLEALRGRVSPLCRLK